MKTIMKMAELTQEYKEYLLTIKPEISFMSFETAREISDQIGGQVKIQTEGTLEDKLVGVRNSTIKYLSEEQRSCLVDPSGREFKSKELENKFYDLSTVISMVSHLLDMMIYNNRDAEVLSRD